MESGIQQLRAVVARLRAPGGCPWDQEQTHASLRSGLIEEAYEVVAAIDAQDDPNLREELGDLLLQVVFHSQIAQEEGRFDFDAVARDNAEKLIRRHPHVFGAEKCADSDAVLVRWDEIKKAEKAAAGNVEASVLDGVPASFPALVRASKIQKKAGKVGFDWPTADPVFAKIDEEVAEVKAVLAGEGDGADGGTRLEEELGDLLFAAVNLSRKLGVDAETALNRATRKFETRFRAMEHLARERGVAFEELTLEEQDVYWNEVKSLKH